MPWCPICHTEAEPSGQCFTPVAALPVHDEPIGASNITAAALRKAWIEHSDRITKAFTEATRLYCFAESCGLEVDDSATQERFIAELLEEGATVDLIAHAINIQGAEDDPTLDGALAWLTRQRHLIHQGLEGGIL